MSHLSLNQTKSKTPRGFLLDENISYKVGEVLKKLGYLIVKPTPGTPDDKIALQAQKEKLFIITLDIGFANILTYPPKSYYGIVNLRFEPAFNNVLIAALEKFLKQYELSDLGGKLFIVGRDRIRIFGED